ncbi:MAG: ABC transporter substrate-binding protein [Thermoplasmata archaeon]|nr:ABC transporter substrate-binding protein [Thermoplasmata archaeon]
MIPRTRNILVIVIVVILVIAGIGVYFLLKKSVPTCNSSERTYICIDQAETPDSLDPDVTFTTPGWAAVQQVYQGLVNYNGSSVTTFAGVLAQNWTVSENPATNISSYTFTLRSGVTFSNGDPYNAYVQWYSLYRSLLLIQGPQFILEQNFYSTNFDPSSPLSYYSNNSTLQPANTTLANDLNSWDFDSPSPSEVSMMGEPNQSFQVLGPLLIRLNLGYGYLASNYTYFLASLSAPNSYAVDPDYVSSHGGVLVGSVTTDPLADYTLGTGPYVLNSYSPGGGGGYTLTPNSKYWGATPFVAEPWNVNLAPANTSVQVIFQDAVDVTTNDLESGSAQEASYAYTGPSTINELMGHSNVVVQPLPLIYGATSGSWWIYLNASVKPFNNLSVREAIAHAINYQQIISQAFGGYASQWVGPVPPGYPYNNNVTAQDPYEQYNLKLAYQEMADSPCANGACASIDSNYMYLNQGTDWATATQFIAADLKAINITINPVGVGLNGIYQEQAYDPGSNGQPGQCASATGENGGPFPIGQEFYTSDYISPDDWTQNDAVSSGSANVCMAGYSNQTVDNDTYLAASNSTPSVLTGYYANMTQLLYNNYSEIWLVVPTSFAVYSSNLHGFVQNPMASAEPFAIGFNTQWLS